MRHNVSYGKFHIASLKNLHETMTVASFRNLHQNNIYQASSPGILGHDADGIAPPSHSLSAIINHTTTRMPGKQDKVSGDLVGQYETDF